MRKSFLFMLCALTFISLCSCGKQQEAKIRANESTFIVNFNNRCEDDVYGIHFEYYLADVAQGGGVVGNADGTALADGDTLSKDFIPADFKASEDLDHFKIEIFLRDQDGGEYACADSVEWDAVFGAEYTISITGSYADGFASERTDTTFNP